MTTENKLKKVDACSLAPKQGEIFATDKPKAPTVWYTTEVWNKIKFAIDYCQQEVGWLGLVEEREGGYIITDVFFPKQTVHAAETDIDPEDMAELGMWLEENVGEGTSEKLRYWGHSHVNMQVRPSGQDEEQTAEYLQHCDFFIRAIHNKKGDRKVDVFDVTNNVQFEYVTNGVYLETLSEQEEADLKAVLDSHVKKQTYTGQYESPRGRGSAVSGRPTVHNTMGTNHATTAGGTGNTKESRASRRERRKNRKQRFRVVGR